MRYLFFLLVVNYPAKILAFDYFNENIDYWNEIQSKPKKANLPRDKPKEKGFDWNKYTNPKNDEFFEEGNYKPPKPFMELARNPNDKNIERWFKVIETKNRLMSRLQNRLSIYLERKGKNLKPEYRSELEKKREKFTVKQIDIKRFRFRLYFDSSCPHCEKMMQTVQELQTMGYYVEVRQIDRDTPKFSVPFPITPASQEEVKAKNINSWPVLFVADTGKRLVYRLQGYQSAQTVLGKLSQK